jgi:hypothetical protein
MAWVAQITGYDIVNAAAKTLRFSLGSGIAFIDQPYCPGGMTRWMSATQKINFDNNGQVTTTSDTGELAITNLPDDVYSGGALDAVLEWAWQGREATLWWAPTNVWADALLMARGTLEQPVGNLAVGSGDTSSISFPIRDPRNALIAPLQTTKFGGTNVQPDGVDGSADLKGQPQPVMYGLVSNIPGVVVNSQKLIWKIADVAVLIVCVRDGSLPITPLVQRANTASLEANIPPPGFYDWVADATGTYVRLGATPQARLTFDGAEGGSAANRTHAQIWSRIRQQRCGTASGNLSIGTTDTDAPNQAGFWWDSAIDQRSALDQVLASLSGYEVQDSAGVWHLAQVKAPTAAADINLMRITETSMIKVADRPIINLSRVRPNYAPNGAPPYRVNVNWGLNYTVMSQADFLGAAQQRLIDKFSKQWRVETANDVTIWDPDASTGLFPNAPELTINTGYQPGSDNLTSPHAAAEATRLLALYSGLKAHYQASFSPEPGDFILPGDIVSLTFPGFGLSTGPKFLVLQSGLEVVQRRATASLVIGFQN